MDNMRLPDGRHRLLVSASILALVTACAQFPTQDHGPTSPVNVSNVPNAVPKYVSKSPYGNAPTYSVDGKTYHVLPSCAGYHERGIASWYGMKFHGARTSDGDIYDMYTMTAASKVLPLP
ncbi:MAG: septal ring lytic transglycosylase RlpA family lipoprotein, partial [Gammaproteobacteria bacterium]|nr:septal ring lytic transglycosylase RlpA family lipoprotein [Gammaproteobacteria bacterium]